MLHTTTASARTLTLLRFIQAQPVFCDMRLVGGTSLGLQMEIENLNAKHKNGIEVKWSTKKANFVCKLKLWM
jgi:hypothetical protein